MPRREPLLFEAIGQQRIIPRIQRVRAWGMSSRMVMVRYRLRRVNGRTERVPQSMTVQSSEKEIQSRGRGRGWTLDAADKTS
ncbi:hypothetical protein BM221_007464 [Beauveria bassiana]|uniref:Uncharacterized protein n=1 Tax=Beauveria bassiana TaxID=176275 RepID=A0A2N6NGR0_BEABA|nr:hypothetical protein BM221_007464 [Beauveria bassiana]